MKKHLLMGTAVFMALSAVAQKPVKEHYTVSGGLLGALNLSKFRVVNNNNIDYDFDPGWSAGAWVNFPLGKSFSIEPQVMYGRYGYKADQAVFLADANIDYWSVPLLLKFHLGRNFALTAGPQFDFTNTVDDNNNVNDKDDVTKNSTSIFGGFEIAPHSRVSVFGRYIHGLTNMENSSNPNTRGEWKNQAIQVGLKFKLFGRLVPGDQDGDGVIDKDDKCISTAGLARYNGCPIPDTDGDGINDEEDKCPQQAGLAKYQGCPIPDTDKDGINDEQDKCPNQPGVAAYQGCPVPDTDGDGVKDDVDKCPTVPGLASLQGCPNPDTDGDGINDDVDKCPKVPGVARMQGCPEVENYKGNAVTFAVNSDVLTAGGKSQLDLLYDYMTTHQDVRVRLDGYTDASGNDKINIPLSDRRAKSAKAYLVGKGIAESRLETVGHGAADPVADNKTKEGKALNRRIEATVL